MTLRYDRVGDGRHTPPNIATISYALGLIGGIGLTLSICYYLDDRPEAASTFFFSLFKTDSRWPDWRARLPVYGFHLFLLSLFHCSEYVLQAVFHPKNIDLSGISVLASVDV